MITLDREHEFTRQIVSSFIDSPYLSDMRFIEWLAKYHPKLKPVWVTSDTSRLLEAFEFESEKELLAYRLKHCND